MWTRSGLARICFILTWGSLLPTGCRAPPHTIDLLQAKSLSPLVREVAERFEKNHPNAVIRAEAYSNLNAIYKVGAFGKPYDLVATADYRLIQRFLMPSPVSTAYRFLGNKIVLATASNRWLASTASNLYWKENWHEELSSRTYRYGDYK